MREASGQETEWTAVTAGTIGPRSWALVEKPRWSADRDGPGRSYLMRLSVVNHWSTTAVGCWGAAVDEPHVEREIESQMLADELGQSSKNVLVLGAGGGIGQQAVTVLAQAGCDLTLGDVDPAAAERSSDLAVEHGRRGVAIAVDVMDPDSVTEAVASAERELGPLYGLVTVVGGAAGWAPIVEMTTEMWDSDMHLNVRYFFIAAREVARSLIARGAPGSMVCVSSIDGFRATGYHAGYGASKAAMMHLVKTMAAEWGPHGIRVNSVAPGSTITPGTPFLGDADRRPGIIPLRHRGEAIDIANAIGFLMSAQARYVTGLTIPVDGGATPIGPFAFGASPADHVLGKQEA